MTGGGDQFFVLSGFVGVAHFAPQCSWTSPRRLRSAFGFRHSPASAPRLCSHTNFPMRCHLVGCGTEVLNDNFSCTWTLCSRQSGNGWPQRSQVQPGVPSLGRGVTLPPPTFCNLGLGDPFSSCNKRTVFISYSIFAWQTYGPLKSTEGVAAKSSFMSRAS